MGKNSYGKPGGEASRKYEALRDTRQNLNRRRNWLQKFIAVTMDVDAKNIQKEKAWEKGAKGEQTIGLILDEIAAKYSFVVMHDRAIPNSRANIDHILVTQHGVFVIDAKNYRGLIRIDEGATLDFSAVKTLFIGKRNQMGLIAQVKKQIMLVNDVLAENQVSIPVYGVLAFYEAEFPIFFRPTEIDGVLINGKGIEALILGKSSSDSYDVKATVSALLKAFKEK